MTLGYRGITALLALPFAAYAVASVVQSYRPVVGAVVAKTEPLPPADEFVKGRERVQRASAGAQAIGNAADTYSPEKITETLPDDMRKLAQGVVEHNQLLDNLRLFLTGAKDAKYNGTMAKQFADASRESR
jgi:hypothetical protein